MAEQLSRKQQCVSSNLTIASTILARVPGVGLLNRTCKSWVERHEVQFLRGLPQSENGCVAQTGLEQASHKREVGGSTPPTATKTFSICDCRFPIGLFQSRWVPAPETQSAIKNWQLEMFWAGDVTTA